MCGATLLAAQDLVSGAAEWAKWLQVLLVMALVAAEPRRSTPWLLAALLLSGAIQAVIGGWQFALRGHGPESFLVAPGLFRAYGGFEQPNPFGGYMGMVWPLAAALAAGLWRAHQIDRHKLLSAACAFVALLSAGALLASYSRGAWLGAGAAAAILLLGALRPASARPTLLLVLLAAALLVAGRGLWLLASYSRGAWLGAGAAAAILLLGALRPASARPTLLLVLLAAALLVAGRGLWPQWVVARVSSITQDISGADVRGVVPTTANFAVVERLAHWQAAAEMAAAHPWLGVGLGNYAAAYDRYRLARWPLALGHAHNFYLNLAAETGLPGLLIFVALLLAAALQALRVLRTAHGWQRALALGLLAAGAHLAIHNVVDNLFVNNVHLYLASMLGILATAQPRTPSTAQ
ncbi:MAG: O-antigen ligase domain-containing protein [Chloroflexi bacterium]|nr:MAG: O-antigen ligase domain-containing protein [Chloroflexota bacterium]